jgi:hypothetical protein
MPVVISNTVLVLAESFGEDLEAGVVAEAIARGLQADGRLQSDLCLVGGEGKQELERLDFDRRMHAARAIVIVWRTLREETLAGSLAFEAATRARQSGVPAYAVTAEDELDPFEARIVDLQVILQASTKRALSAAARKLAGLI